MGCGDEWERGFSAAIQLIAISAGLLDTSLGRSIIYITLIGDEFESQRYASCKCLNQIEDI